MPVNSAAICLTIVVVDSYSPLTSSISPTRRYVCRCPGSCCEKPPACSAQVVASGGFPVVLPSRVTARLSLLLPWLSPPSRQRSRIQRGFPRSGRRPVDDSADVPPPLPIP